MINYKNIYDSQKFYEEFGFEIISCPWIVPSYIDDVTRPLDRIPYKLENNLGNIIGSGEQSFLFLYDEGVIKNGMYQTVTPCFRDEKEDETHKKFFMKNELIQIGEVSDLDLTSIIDICLDFFHLFLRELKVVKTSEGYDIESKGIELGSYGIRKFKDIKYIFATGCAEPRLSTVIKMNNI